MLPDFQYLLATVLMAPFLRAPATSGLDKNMGFPKKSCHTRYHAMPISYFHDYYELVETTVLKDASALFSVDLLVHVLT